MNAVKAYQAAYPRSSEKAARSNATRLMENDGIQARIAEIMAVGAERAEVTAEEVIHELKKLGFSCIGKAVMRRSRWNASISRKTLRKPPGGSASSTRCGKSRSFVRPTISRLRRVISPNPGRPRPLDGAT